MGKESNMKKVAKFLLGLIGLTAICHVFEWFLIGKKVAAQANIPVKVALPNCLLRGFLWWKPIKKGIK